MSETWPSLLVALAIPFVGLALMFLGNWLFKIRVEDALDQIERKKRRK